MMAIIAPTDESNEYCELTLLYVASLKFVDAQIPL